MSKRKSANKEYLHRTCARTMSASQVAVLYLTSWQLFTTDLSHSAQAENEQLALAEPHKAFDAGLRGPSRQLIGLYKLLNRLPDMAMGRLVQCEQSSALRLCCERGDRSPSASEMPLRPAAKRQFSTESCPPSQSVHSWKSNGSCMASVRSSNQLLKPS